MTKADLIEKLSDRLGLAKVEAEKCVEGFLEERGVVSTNDPVALDAVSSKPFGCACRDWKQAASTVLSALDAQHPFIEINIFFIEPECLVHAQSGNRDQPNSVEQVHPRRP